jgi:very-short-patch-repair endonuclease
LGRSLNIRPNFPEKQILNFLEKNLPGNFSYTGDFSFWVGRKNPDFIDKHNKKIIEFFGNHFHEKHEEGERKLYFKKYGYDTLIIWETEFRLEKENTHKRILEFGGKK